MRSGHLSRLLPGVYAPIEAATSLETRLAAVPAWSPDAVVVGRAAASMTFWPDLAVPQIEVAHGCGRAPMASGYRFARRGPDPDWVIELPFFGERTLRLCAPAMTAIDLVPELGGKVIAEALRSRMVSLADLELALAATPGRPGNARRRRMLDDSRDSPWGELERHAHELLHRAGIRGWTGNGKVLINGLTYYIDVCFRSLKVAVEIDGLEHQTDLSRFVSDRQRQNALVLAGWIVLRFSWVDLRDHPQVVIAQIRAALAMARRAQQRAARP
ncbi:DUF559 domain-containing protein [Microlunatus elymi]|uniref:DUF559 domain-containing protein n=1 Tax=Microlunatus elymi TaxID=2596828 RepID=A0A516PYR3_9ACTN|nr:DUF559 domain-containing protein [Microlunatus elymi]QDP96316.1 DUF559 domain-containing protein [Microlunatus elymi]